MLLVRCKVVKCKDAGLICERKNSDNNSDNDISDDTLVIDDSNFSNCACGVGVLAGNCNIIMYRSKMTNNAHCGISIGAGCIGSVVLTECTLISNGVHSFENSSDSRCVVMVDDVEFSSYKVANMQVRPQKCDNCQREEEASKEKFKKCCRCKLAWYCSRDCQVGSIFGGNVQYTA